MTTARTLIQAAFREGNLIPVGTSPSTNELAEGLARLNRYVRGVFGSEMGEPLDDWLYPSPQRTSTVAANFPQLPYAQDPSYKVTQNPPKNSRIVWGGNADTSIYFPESPDDGSRMGLTIGTRADLTKVLTVDGNGRKIEGLPTVSQPTPPVNKEWLYRADLGDWTLVADMTIDGECPFPDQHDDLWITLLAIRLAPRFGKPIQAETQAIAAAAMKRFKTQYRQSQDTIYGSQDHPRSLQSYIVGRWFGP